jgi:hypothetical protein
MWNNFNPRLAGVAWLCCLMLVFACRPGRTRGNTSGDMKQIEWTTLARGSYSGIEEKKFVMIVSRQEWEELWKEAHKNITPVPELPAVDFTGETVLGVFMGTRSTGGYSIEIDRIGCPDGIIQAIIKTRSPEPGDMVTTALTQPFHIVRVSTAGMGIEFIEK